ncbi:MAG: HAMP domain-containing protein [Candidatus Glassbacteria bacterium]|nr:HAMP domain-containing protein [Candidatus Glassbacteria bacterium]
MEQTTRSKAFLSLRFKTIITLILVHSILISTLIFYTIAGHHRMVEEITKEHYTSIYSTFAPLVVEAVQNKDLDAIRWFLAGLENNPEIIYAAIFDKNNMLLDKWSRAEFKDHLHLEFLKQQDERPTEASSHEIGHPSGFFHREGHNFNFLIPFERDQTYLGKVHIGINTARINQRLAEESVRGIQITVGAIILGMLVILAIDRRLRNIMTRLIRVTRKMAEGDLSEKVEIRTGDEIEVLGNSFNLMAGAIQEREAVIEKHKSHLEEMVQERTRELAEERDKLQAILDHIPSAVIFLNNNLKIKMVNARFESIVKRSSTDFLERQCSEGLCPWLGTHECKVKECLEDGEIKSRLIHKKTGSLYGQHFEQLAIPLFRENQPYGVLEIITDISAKYEMQHRLIRAEKLSTTGKFAALLAHEIRNSLTSTKMILQLLLEKVRENERNDVAVALDATLKMEQKVNDLLKFARPEKIRKSSHNLHRLIEECVQLAQHQFQIKSIHLDLDLDPHIKKVLLDRDHMEKVFINLFFNAVDAIAESGSVKITTQLSTLSDTLYDYAALPADENDVSSSAAVQKIVLNKGEPVVIIEVSDTGEGIPPESIPRIFDPFYTTKTKGSGLGLSLTKRIINAHDGIITVQSELKKGSTFTIYLPSKAPSE